MNGVYNVSNRKLLQNVNDLEYSTVGGAQIRYSPNKKTFKPSNKDRDQFWAKMVRRVSDEKYFGGVAFFTFHPPGVQ